MDVHSLLTNTNAPAHFSPPLFLHALPKAVNSVNIKLKDFVTEACAIFILFILHYFVYVVMCTQRLNRPIH